MDRLGDVARSVGDGLTDGRLVAGAGEPVPVAEAGLHRAREEIHRRHRLDRILADRAASSESITAEVPSSTALATSLASARVGSGAWSIDSSIWVAVITGFPRSSAMRIMRFCKSGTDKP